MKAKMKLWKRLQNWSIVGGLLISIGLALIFISLVALFYEAPELYYSEVLIEEDRWKFYPLFDIIQYKMELSSGDKLLIDLKVVTDTVIFYIKDGYGNEWMKRRTEGFVESWNVPTAGTYFIIIEKPYFFDPSGYITVTRYLANPEYRLTTPYSKFALPFFLFGLGVIFFGFALAAYCSEQAEKEMSKTKILLG